MDTEVWKPVVGYEGLYEASNFGKIKSLWNWNSSNSLRKVLSPNNMKIKYKQVYLSKRWKGNTNLVHRIVAKAFIPNPEDKPQVNHINWIKTDNRVENLEWCTRSENSLHAYRQLWKIFWFRKSKFCHNRWKILWLSNSSKMVAQMDINWYILNKFSCWKEASIITKINRWNISACCLGRRNYAGGFKWGFII